MPKSVTMKAAHTREWILKKTRMTCLKRRKKLWNTMSIKVKIKMNFQDKSLNQRKK